MSELDLEKFADHEERVSSKSWCWECHSDWPCSVAQLRAEVERLRADAKTAREQRAAAWDEGVDAVARWMQAERDASRRMQPMPPRPANPYREADQ